MEEVVTSSSSALSNVCIVRHGLHVWCCVVSVAGRAGRPGVWLVVRQPPGRADLSRHTVDIQIYLLRHVTARGLLIAGTPAPCSAGAGPSPVRAAGCM